MSLDEFDPVEDAHNRFKWDREQKLIKLDDIVYRENNFREILDEYLKHLSAVRSDSQGRS